MWILFIFLAQMPQFARSQTTLQVVTKTIQKTSPWKPGQSLEINCEKAEILVETAPEGQKSIQIRAELSARHPKLDSARHDLDTWKFVVSSIGKKIYVRAYVGVSSKEALPTSNLKAKITVTAPAGCPVVLTNKFGSAALENRVGAVQLSGEFCAFTLIEMTGGVQVDSKYGNVEGRGLKGPVDIQSKRADVSLSNLTGDCTIKNEYGRVRLEGSSQTGNVSISNSKGDVILNLAAPYRHNLELNAGSGTVRTPLSFQLDAGASVTNSHATLHQGKAMPKISVQTTIGNIILE
ncbi:MAG: DUF4097 family beta strand repeat protein [Saprospiraceae bacterium]|nr:DUF4097 family beta strand repeat protein [Saprospiraceae bacterium]